MLLFKIFEGWSNSNLATFGKFLGMSTEAFEANKKYSSHQKDEGENEVEGSSQ